MIASEDPCVLVPVVSPGALKSSANIRMHRCWISNVIGYSAWSMKFRWRFVSITRRASGSIAVVTNVARFRSGMPSTASSSWTRRAAAIGAIASSGIAPSGAFSVIQAPVAWVGISALRSVTRSAWVCRGERVDHVDAIHVSSFHSSIPGSRLDSPRPGRKACIAGRALLPPECGRVSSALYRRARRRDR